MDPLCTDDDLAQALEKIEVLFVAPLGPPERTRFEDLNVRVETYCAIEPIAPVETLQVQIDEERKCWR